MRKAIQALGFGALVVGGTLVSAVPQGGAAAGDDVVITGRQFSPRETTVEVGTEVTWTNKDTGHVHSVTADDGSFDSNPTCSAANPGACMDDRDQFAHVFSAEGRYPYYSRTSGGPGGQGTSGVVVVVPAGTPTPEEPSTTTSTSATS
jgi:plastocyanin